MMFVAQGGRSVRSLEGVGLLRRQQNNIKVARTDPIDPLLGSMMVKMMSCAEW